MTNARIGRILVASLHQAIAELLPTRLGVYAQLLLAGGRSLVGGVHPGSRAVTRLRRGTATVDVRGSLFCDVREAGSLPLCGFYAAAFAAIFERLAVPARARGGTCR